MTGSDLLGLASQGVLVGGATALLAGLLMRARAAGGTPAVRRPVPWWIPAAAALATVAIPFGGDGLTASAHLRGLWGDPSVISTLLVALAAFRPRWLPRAPRPAVLTAFAVGIGAPFLLGTFAGLRPLGIDLHALGWTAWPVIIGAAAVAAMAWRGRHGAWIAIIGLALAAWGAGWVESDNVWDALVDPGLIAVATVGAVVGLRSPRAIA